MGTGTLLLLFVLLIVGYAIFIYNKLIRNRTMVEEGWSGIETQLKRRANLIPNLVETVKGFASHEQETLEKVTSMRTTALNASGVGDRAAAESGLTAAIGGLMAVAENYPDLKANENFIGLQDDLAETEDQIQLARRYYNGTVRNLNILIDSFPSNLIATQFKFQKAQFFEIEEPGDRAVPKVSFN